MVRLSLKGKMTLAVSLFTIVLLTTMSYYTFSYFQTEFKEVIASQQSLLLSYIADDIDNKLNRAQENLIQMSKKIQWYEAINPDQAQSFLDDNNIENTFDNGMFLFSNSGKLIAETPFLPNRRGKDFSFREYLRDTMETASPHISDPYISSKTHFPAIMFTAPVFDPRGKIVAVMGGSIDLMNSNILGSWPAYNSARPVMYTSTTQTGQLSSIPIKISSWVIPLLKASINSWTNQFKDLKVRGKQTV